MKKELLVLAASLALASSMNASISRTSVFNSDSNNSGISQKGFSALVARESEPGDDRRRNRGKGKDDGKGHKFTQEVARESEPGDDRRRHRGRGKDDGKDHKFTQEVAREAEPGDDRNRG